MSEFSNEMNFLSKWYLKLLAGVIVLLFLAGAVSFFGRRSVQILDTAVIRYEEFQEIYNTTRALNQKLCNLRAITDADPMFKDISKSAQVVGLQNNLTRWIEEYNAKSRMWNRSLWKSQSLPYELNVADFPCHQ